MQRTSLVKIAAKKPGQILLLGLKNVTSFVQIDIAPN